VQKHTRTNRRARTVRRADHDRLQSEWDCRRGSKAGFVGAKELAAAAAAATKEVQSTEQPLGKRGDTKGNGWIGHRSSNRGSSVLRGSSSSRGSNSRSSTKEVQRRKALNEPPGKRGKRTGMAGEATDCQIEGAVSAETAPASSVRRDAHESSNEDGRRGHRSKHRRSGVPKVSSSSRGSADRGSSSRSILANNRASTHEEELKRTNSAYLVMAD
jgi:hypothetical protein